MGPVGRPKVVGAVEPEEDEEGEEDARHPGHICSDQQVSRRRRQVEVAVVDAQEDAADDSFTTFFSETGSGKYIPRYIGP